MTRWMPVIVVGVMVVLTAGACDPPPPPGWKPPTIQTAIMSTETVTAGSSFSVSVVASDDHQVADVGASFYGPGAFDPLRVPCDASNWEPQSTVSVELTCTMPSIAPNGTWKVRVAAYDGEWSGPHGACGCDVEELAFEVVGGSEDHDYPATELATTSPDPIPVGSPSEVTVRISDEHPVAFTDPLYLTYDVTSGNPKVCTQRSQTQLSPTQFEWTFDCPPHATPGDYLGLVWVHDEMGYSTNVRLTFHVVP